MYTVFRQNGNMERMVSSRFKGINWLEQNTNKTEKEQHHTKKLQSPRLSLRHFVPSIKMIIKYKNDGKMKFRYYRICVFTSLPKYLFPTIVICCMLFNIEIYYIISNILACPY